MKVIEDIKLLKKLAPYLGDTRFILNVYINWEWVDTVRNIYHRDTMPDIYKDPLYYNNYKTLSIDEAIEFLPKYIWPDKLKFEALGRWRQVQYTTCVIEADFTLLQAIEKMLNYLIDNNLLWK